jgi:hypothetical protein
MPLCSSCTHFRLARPPNPLQGIRLVSSKALELRAKWQQELASRALLEQQRFEAGLPFDFEPLAYPYCAHFSRVEKTKEQDFVLCAAANVHDDCAAFEPRTS